jgi:hypothetical protein
LRPGRSRYFLSSEEEEGREWHRAMIGQADRRSGERNGRGWKGERRGGIKGIE